MSRLLVGHVVAAVVLGVDRRPVHRELGRPARVATARCASKRKNAQSGESGPSGQKIAGSRTTGGATVAICRQASGYSARLSQVAVASIRAVSWAGSQ